MVVSDDLDSSEESWLSILWNLFLGLSDVFLLFFDKRYGFVGEGPPIRHRSHCITSRAHTMNVTSCFDVDLDHPAEVACVKFFHCEGTPFYAVLFRGKSPGAPPPSYLGVMIYLGLLPSAQRSVGG